MCICNSSVVVVVVVVVYLFIHLYIYLPIYYPLPTYLSTYLSVYLSIYLPIYLSICKHENAAILRHFRKLLNLTTSKTKQFCETSSILELDTIQNEAIRETSSIFELDNIKNEAILQTSFKYGKLSAELTASYQYVLRFFHSTCLKYCACHKKVMPGHTNAAPVTQNHLSKPTEI